MDMATLETITKSIINVPNKGQGVYRYDWKKFMKGLDKGTVDLVLTEPPYAISRDNGFSNVKNGVDRFAVSMDFGKWDNDTINLAKFCSECHRVLKTSGTVIIWYDLWKITDLENAMRDAGFKMIRLIIWQKTNPVPLNQSATYLSNSREIAVTGVKGGKPTFNGKYDNGVYEHPIPRHGGQKIHPTQKPIDLFSELVVKHSNKGDMVIDPFLGSGTTGVAAVANGRNFEGCDIDPDYVKAARMRIAGARDGEKKGL